MQTETFTLLVMCQWFNVLNCQSATRSTLRLGVLRNPWLLGGLLLSVVLQAAVIYAPPLNAWFHTVPIEPAALLPLVGLASMVLWAEELAQAAGAPARPRRGSSRGCHRAHLKAPGSAPARSRCCNHAPGKRKGATPWPTCC